MNFTFTFTFLNSTFLCFRISTVDISGKASNQTDIDNFQFPFQLYMQHLLAYAKPGDDIIDIGCGNVPVSATYPGRHVSIYQKLCLSESVSISVCISDRRDALCDDGEGILLDR